MMRKFTALLAAIAVAGATLAPATATAREGRYYRGDYDRHRHYRHHDDHGDAVAAGVVGLVLGLAIGSLASQPRTPQARCSNNYQRCAPPPQRYSDQSYYSDQGYYDDGYDDPYKDAYDNPDSAYARDYGGGGQRMCRDTQFDDRGRPYTVELPC